MYFYHKIIAIVTELDRCHIMMCFTISMVCKFNILHIKLENAYSRPQYKGFGGLTPRWGAVWMRPPKGTKTGDILCLPRPPTLLQHNRDLRVWSYPPHSYIFKVSSKSVRTFERSKFALSHYFGYWLVQQLVLTYKPWLLLGHITARAKCCLLLQKE